jgi:hypothetical protein
VPSCFIAMPVSTSNEHARLYGDVAHFEHVLRYLMIPAVERAGYEAIEPIAAGADLIHAEIIRQLETADLVLCDISTLNPNVFFELGVRTAVDRPICVVKDALTERIPFDTSIINVHTYEPSLSAWHMDKQLNALVEHLRVSAQRSEGRNALWRYFGLTTRAAFKEGGSTLEEKVDLVLLQLQGLESEARSRAIALEPDFYSDTYEDTYGSKPAPEEVDGSIKQLKVKQDLMELDSRIDPAKIQFRRNRVLVGGYKKHLTSEEMAKFLHAAARHGLRLEFVP